jgi:hypothetical protein
MAIGESAFFIPIEVYELLHRFSPTVGRAGHQRRHRLVPPCKSGTPLPASRLRPPGVDEAPVRVEIPPGVTPMKTSLLMACWVCWIGLATAAAQVEPVKSSPVPAAQMPAVAASTNPAPAMPEGFHVANGSPRSALTESLVNRLARELGTKSVEAAPTAQRSNRGWATIQRHTGAIDPQPAAAAVAEPLGATRGGVPASRIWCEIP